MRELQEVESLETQKLEQGHMSDDENMQDVWNGREGWELPNWVEDKNGAWSWGLFEGISKMQTLDMVAI